MIEKPHHRLVIVGMTTALKLGEEVQVRQVVMSNYVGEEPTYHWCAGYTLEGIIDGVAVVKVRSGFSAGCLVNYNLSDVRSAV